MKFAHAFYINLLLVLLSSQGLAQVDRIVIKGKVVESEGSLPIEYATVLVAQKESGEMITGTTTNQDGTFTIDVSDTNFYIEVRFIGFVTKHLESFTMINGIIDLETVQLVPNSNNLNELTVVAEKSSVEFKLDKRVFNVGKDLSTSGASAIEVLNNVPSVTVGVEGEISLRGSQGVQILINGKPSVLSSEGVNALGTISADAIEKVEVITNPSAKYDAEGTSGIINIVLKKNEEQGLNGAVTLNTGFPNNHSLGMSLNKRTEKWNLFSQIGVGYRTFPSENTKSNEDLATNSIISASGTSEKNEAFFNIVLGADYHLSANDVITLSGRYAYEYETELSQSNYQYLERGNSTQEWSRQESTAATNPKWQYELVYKKDFKNDKEHDLLVSASGRFFGKNQASTFNDYVTLGARDDFSQKTTTDFKEGQYTFKLDYVHPLGKKVIMETGAQYLVNDISNAYQLSNKANEIYVTDTNFTNDFLYNQGVLGVYTTAAYKVKNWGLKAGLRYENTHLATTLLTTGEENLTNYGNFFPSIHSSYKLNKKASVQAGYSKRIYRPRLWDLNPFFNIRDNFNIFTGNPDLLPEYTDSYEFTGIYTVDKISMNIGVYYRYTTGLIEDITVFEDNRSLTKPYNAGTSGTTGFEYNMKYTPVNWATVMADFNFNQFNRAGEFEGTSFNFNGNSWSSKITTKLKLPQESELEVSGHYNSKVKTIQGENSSNYFVDFGIRKKIKKGKIILNLSVRDVFATRRRESRTNQPDFNMYSNSMRGRFFLLGVSFGFGKGEAMEFSGNKRF